MLCFNVDLEIRFNFELGNTDRTLVECEFVMVEVVDVIEVKIELDKKGFFNVKLQLPL